MKIIQVVQTYHPSIGGIETLVRQISEALVQLGHSVEVITTNTHNSPQQETLNGVLITRFHAFTKNKSYHIAPAIYSYLKNKPYDVIHAHNYHSLTAFIASLTAHNLVFTSHTNGIGATPTTTTRNVLRYFYKHTLGQYLINKSDAFIFMTDQERSILSSMFDLSNKSTYTIPLPISIKFAVPKQTSEHRNTRIGYLARLAKVKNPQLLCEAFKIVHKKYPDITLHIAGDGELMPYLKTNYDNYYTTFLGSLEHDQALRFLSTIDIFVMPSNLEVSCISAFEAMASGVPVISTPIGDLPESFKHREHLLFTEFNNPVQLAKNIFELIENKSLVSYLTKNAFEEIKKRDIDTIIERYMEVYNSVASIPHH